MSLQPIDGTSLTEHLKAGDRVFAAGLTGESVLLREELLQHPERAAGVEFTSVQLAGIDGTDYLALHPESRTRAYFMTPGARAGVAQGRTLLHPLDYTGIARHLLDAMPFDSVIAEFTPPDRDGWCAPGLSADFTPLVWKRAKRRIGHINPCLPRFSSGFRVHMSEFDKVVDRDRPALHVAASPPSEVNEQIARHAANLIRDGDTLQFGLGSVMPAVGRALRSHRRLRIHSGMISSFVETMWESGALDRQARVVTGVVFGDSAFYDYLECAGCIHLEDVRITHGIDRVSRIERFVGVNSAVEVDLFGQINSERSDETIQAGAGGLPAYAQASQLAPGGRLLICLPATARGGKVSRIVPSLGTGALCTVPRHMADTVVTEFGVAELRGLAMTERPEALIAIAAPEHRGSLFAAWEAMRRRL
jgi:acyl-CoA hydrolase